MPSAGWYEDPDVPDGQRYWDGSAWTAHRAVPSGDDRTAQTGRTSHNEAPRHCPACGGEVGRAARFCRTCGHKLPAATQAPTPPAPAADPPPPAQSPVPRPTHAPPGAPLIETTPSVELPKKHCPRCRAEIGWGSRFCKACGQAVVPSEMPRDTAAIARAEALMQLVEESGVKLEKIRRQLKCVTMEELLRGEAPKLIGGYSWGEGLVVLTDTRLLWVDFKHFSTGRAVRLESIEWARYRRGALRVKIATVKPQLYLASLRPRGTGKKFERAIGPSG